MDASEAKSDDSIKITVKFKGKPIPVSLSQASTVSDLKSLLLPLTDVLPRGQKLICKGKILEDQATLTESGVVNGAKLMLIATQGLHQGSGSGLANAKTQIPGRLEPGDFFDPSDLSSRLKLTKITGVAALCQAGLKLFPRELYDYASAIRVLDLKENNIEKFDVGIFSNLQKLHLDGNDLVDIFVDWDGIATLPKLTILTMSHNRLMTIPHEVGALCSLKHLDISCNHVTGFPCEIGLLTQLEVLKAGDNRLFNLPGCIGRLSSLVELDLSANFLSELPDAIGNLSNMRSLDLSNNALTSLPQKLFTMCKSLVTLNLHENEITMDALRQCEGWEEFDRRRVAQQQKKIDFGVLGAEQFDEGADDA